ncbi:MAG: Gfo/Idh/MocA family oxidoreductase, partial [bacterium]|nr:Gfo/Idh/MocA family oxidoreductase [bacterium]
MFIERGFGMQKVRYGIIGCGEHARRAHLIPAKEIQSLELVAVSDFSQDRMNLFENEVGYAVKKYSTAKELLASDVDAVLIATPDESHAQLLVQAIRAHKHVLCEKPLAVDDEQFANVVCAM